MLRLIQRAVPRSSAITSMISGPSRPLSALHSRPLRPLPFAHFTKAQELSSLLYEVQQMRIVPPAVAERLTELQDKPEELRADSVLRKRRLKMKKHKLRKRRKAQRALRTKLKKD